MFMCVQFISGGYSVFRSPIWKYFERQSHSYSSRCRTCGFVLKGMFPSNAKMHLRAKHLNVFEEYLLEEHKTTWLRVNARNRQALWILRFIYGWHVISHFHFLSSCDSVSQCVSYVNYSWRCGLTEQNFSFGNRLNDIINTSLISMHLDFVLKLPTY